MDIFYQRSGKEEEKLVTMGDRSRCDNSTGCNSCLLLGDGVGCPEEVVVWNVGGWTGREAKGRKSGGAVSIPLEVGGFGRLEKALGEESTIKFLSQQQTRTSDMKSLGLGLLGLITLR
ncbi:hypothetical protein CRENBAI_000264 [Crenichthys baileyi]|uniref:Uncharacterized protein n=1 Tax=Crenichthys baileyi TaxID=28760 RepID=A0AAV9S366_9TELE